MIQIKTYLRGAKVEMLETIYVTKVFLKKMYDELSEEIKKDEYNNTYAWFT